MSTPPDIFDTFLDDLSILTSDNGDTPSVGTATQSDIFDSAPKNGTNKVGAGVVTIFPNTCHESVLWPSTYFDDPDAVLLQWCGKFETCPKTDKLHCHIFFKFKNERRMRFVDLRKLFASKNGVENVNIQTTRAKTKKAYQGAINYVLKDESTTEGTVPFIWKDTVAFCQKTWDERTVKVGEPERMRLHIESKPINWTWDEIVHEDDDSKKLLARCSWGKKYHEGRHVTMERRKINNIVIMYGAGGTGKSTLARNWDVRESESQAERYYKRNADDGKFFGGGRTAYNGQRVLHLEEFSGTEKFGNIKEWTDKGAHGPSVNIKNGGRDLNHDTVVFTSNVHPAGWYHGIWSKEHKQFHPFWRRITKVMYFPAERPDGSMNIPDGEHEPYYIDQTTEWLAFEGDYQSALDHANSCWPLPEIDTGGAFARDFHLPGVTDGPKRPGDIYMAEQNKRPRY